MTNDSGLVDQLANLEHEQWMEWARTLMDTEVLSKDRKDRWSKFFIPYSELSDKDKESDIQYARKDMEVFRRWLSVKLTHIRTMAGSPIGMNVDEVIDELNKMEKELK